MGAKLIFNNFETKTNLKKKKTLFKYLEKLTNSRRFQFLESFKKTYKYTYDKKFLKKYINLKTINIIGMGGSSLGAKAIYSFLNNKIKKKISFSENLNLKKEKNAKALNIIISKSGNTLAVLS